MSEDFQNTGYILHPAKGKIPFFCNFATVEDLEAAISKLNSLTPKVVDELPPVGESGILYFVPSTDASGEDQSKEYIWLEQENRFELVGSTGVDLSDVVTISSDQVISGTKEFSSSPLVPCPIENQESANKYYVDCSLNASKKYTDDQISGAVKITGNQSIDGLKAFLLSPSVPAPVQLMDAANKSYVDSAVDSVPVFSPSDAQTISGSYDFTNGLTRVTKESPVGIDVMNKQMSDEIYVPKTGNSDISGTKTFTDGIVLSDGKQISLGSGTNAVRIRGTGAGSAVIEADNGAKLDVAVPINIQETLEIDKLETDITGLTPLKIDLFTFKNKNSPNHDMRLYQYTTTSLIGIQGVAQGGGFNVNLNGGVTCESSLLVRGGITSHSGVTVSQSLIVLGIGSFMGGTLSISDSSGDLDKTIEINSDTGGTAISVPPVIGSLYDDDRAVYSRIDNDQRYIKFVELTEAEYKELETKSVSTIYYLSDIAMWTIGDKEIITSDITA